ncbi:hypothetical protein MSG28_009333 [Choristoneura fumiferana]|uniref:Uncharacterized protein n=1 Tax=Choristoneura fumiferana TaxID=7141 RepID=A0ACC0KXM3_CHOFU|nr:hypothetical protein MSG28_009333 [Choristoneura fumiferana]
MACINLGYVHIMRLTAPVTRPSTTREKSPCATLREAKLRLRKLEIEAAAVERSYMDFRRRRERRKSDITSGG